MKSPSGTYTLDKSVYEMANKTINLIVNGYTLRQSSVDLSARWHSYNGLSKGVEHVIYDIIVCHCITIVAAAIQLQDDAISVR